MAKEKQDKKQKHGLARGLTNYGDADFSLYLRRSFAKSMGYSAEMLSRPIVGIAQSASGFNNCHRHFPELVEAVKRGVIAAGGLPLDFPTISLGEVFLHPTSMMFRNLMAMDAEEMIRAQPMDAVVLIGACDKTVPALADGRHLGRPAGHPADRRADAAHGPSRRAARRLHRLPAFLGQIPRRRNLAAGHRGHRRQSRHHRRKLRGDGHGTACSSLPCRRLAWSWPAR